MAAATSWAPVRRCRRVLLSDDEAVAVAVALRAAAGSVAKMEETSIGLLAKLDQVLPAGLRRRASALHSVTITMPGSESAPAVDVLTRIAAACRDNLKLKLSYQRSRRARARHAISSRCDSRTRGRAGISVAWDLDREDWRTFRVDRVQQVSSIGTPFVPRKFPGDIVAYRVALADAHGLHVSREAADQGIGARRRCPSRCRRGAAARDARRTSTAVSVIGADSIDQPRDDARDDRRGIRNASSRSI